MSEPPSNRIEPTRVQPVAEGRDLDRAQDDIRETKRHALEEERKASDFLVQTSLLGGPAAILASLTFLKDIAPNPVPWTATFLLLSWAAYILGAWSALSSLQTKRVVARELDLIIERKLDAGDPHLRKGDLETIRMPNTKSERKAHYAMRLFQAGTLGLILFAALNLPFWKSFFGEKTKPGTNAVGASADSAVRTNLLEICVRSGCTITIPGNSPPSNQVTPSRNPRANQRDSTAKQNSDTTRPPHR